MDNYKAQLHIKSKEYKNIYFKKNCKNSRNKGSWIFNKTIKDKLFKREGFKTEREAAIALDKALMLNGHKPINIFISKK